jgi:hypothetical protein
LPSYCIFFKKCLRFGNKTLLHFFYISRKKCNCELPSYCSNCVHLLHKWTQKGTIWTGQLFAEHFSHCGNKVQMIRPQLSFNSEHELRSKNKKRTRPKWILLRATLALMIASKMYFESTHGRWKVVLESTKKVHFNLGTYKACYFLRKFVFRQYVCGKHCLHASCHPEKNIMCRLLSTVCTLYQHPVTWHS